MLLNEAFPSLVQEQYLTKPTRLQFVTPRTNKTRKPYVCKAEPFNDMGHLNWVLEWKNNKKPANHKQYEEIIDQELFAKFKQKVVDYYVQESGDKYAARFFKTRSKNKSSNVFRYYLSDVFVRIDLNTLNY